MPDEHAFFEDRKKKLAMTLHAEQNAILNAAQSLTGCSLYATCPPCSNCASQIVQTGLTRVVWIRPDAAFAARWAASLELAEWQFNHAGIQTDEYHPSEIS
jgi:dCMP deaminase